MPWQSDEEIRQAERGREERARDEVFREELITMIAEELKRRRLEVEEAIRSLRESAIVTQEMLRRKITI